MSSVVLIFISVAPYVGAWIETRLPIGMLQKYSVAPYVGAWIETLRFAASLYQLRVAPYVGAWIETLLELCHTCPCPSHPMWVRGLKQGRRPFWRQSIGSHPMWVRGLKQMSGCHRSSLCSRTLCGCVD